MVIKLGGLPSKCISLISGAHRVLSVGLDELLLILMGYNLMDWSSLLLFLYNHIMDVFEVGLCA